MANTIIIKQSSVASKVPLTGDLQEGELAINTTDAKIFTKNDSNEVIELGSGSADTTNTTRMSAGAITAVGNLLQYTGVIIEYSHGSDANGYVNTTEEISNGTYSPNLVSNATNYLKQIEGNSTPQGYATYAPVYGALSQFADCFVDGIWTSLSTFDPDGANNPSTTDATPLMTSNTAPSGTASASSITNTSTDAYKAFNNVSNVAGWMAAAGTNTGWIQYEFPIAKAINKYTLTSANSTARSFWKWTVMGSNTGAFAGEEVVLHNVTNEPGWTLNEVRTYSFNNSAYFLYYRIDCTANQGDNNYVGTNEIELIEASTFINGPEYDPTITYLPYTVDVDAGGNITAINDFTGIPSFYTEKLSAGQSQIANLPLSDPGIMHVLWNDNGTLKISAG